jgi:hypothetical protein
LESVRPFDLIHTLDLMPGYVRGLAYAANGQPAEVATEFRSVLDHQALTLHSPFINLAKLQLANVLPAQGQDAAARQLITELETTWKDADSDFPPLRQLHALTARLDGKPKLRLAASR